MKFDAKFAGCSSAAVVSRNVIPECCAVCTRRTKKTAHIRWTRGWKKNRTFVSCARNQTAGRRLKKTEAACTSHVGAGRICAGNAWRYFLVVTVFTNTSHTVRRLSHENDLLSAFYNENDIWSHFVTGITFEYILLREWNLIDFITKNAFWFILWAITFFFSLASIVEFFLRRVLFLPRTPPFIRTWTAPRFGHLFRCVLYVTRVFFTVRCTCMYTHCSTQNKRIRCLRIIF